MRLIYIGYLMLFEFSQVVALSDFESAEFDTKAHRESGYPVTAGSPPAESRIVYAKGRVPSSSMNPERIAR